MWAGSGGTPWRHRKWAVAWQSDQTGKMMRLAAASAHFRVFEHGFYDASFICIVLMAGTGLRERQAREAGLGDDGFGGNDTAVEVNEVN